MQSEAAMASAPLLRPYLQGFVASCRSITPRDLVLGLARQGLTTAEIIELLNGRVTKNAVSQHIHKLRQESLIPAFTPRDDQTGPYAFRCTIGGDVKERLRRAARARNISIVKLSGHLLDKSSELIDAILDDGVSP